MGSNHNPCDAFIPDPDNVWRCWTCGRGYKSASTLKAHITRTHTKRKWRGCTADKEVRNQLRKDEQNHKLKIMCEDAEIDNVWLFKYLGSWFRADGDQKTDIKARIAAATATFGKMRAIWDARISLAVSQSKTNKSIWCM